MEYNTKTRVGIWMCLLMMLLVLAVVLAGVFQTAKAEDRPVSVTNPDDDAIYVNANPITTTASTTAVTTEAVETTTQTTVTTTQVPAPEPEKKALYYVTISRGKVVLLDEHGEFLETLQENAMFLPKDDLNLLRAGIKLYSKEELHALLEDLS